MKRIFTLGLAICALTTSFAQTDTTAKQQPDTIKVGGMVIIREAGAPDSTERRGHTIRIGNRRGDKPANISTNWWIFDIGFSNWNDQTVYGPGTAANAFAPGSTDSWFSLRTGKSRNINIWVLMQRVNITKHVLNLKYGIGLELNNYFFEDKSLRFNKNPTMIDQYYTDLKKNKLAADYLTVPIMLNINFTPQKSRGYGISGGISAGYLYSARQKIKDGEGVDKTKGRFDLETWKLSYVGEISLGYVKLYGSYAFKSMFDKGLDLTPYNFGLRISNW